MVGLGDPARVLALLDPDADLTDRLISQRAAVVQLLRAGDEDLAEAFAGTAPAPGGPFRLRQWEHTSHGPALSDRSQALVSLDSWRPVGWSVLVEAVIENVSLIPGDDALEHRRGRYHHLDRDSESDT